MSQEATSHELKLIGLALNGEAIKCSTSEEITVALALGRLEELPRKFSDPPNAWLRLNLRQCEIFRRFNLSEAEGRRELASLYRAPWGALAQRPRKMTQA